MANYPIKETPVLDLAVRMFETTDRGHADIFNALGEILINNDAFLNAMVGKMIEKGMITHVLDSANASMVLGADVGPKIMQQINAVDKKVIDVSSDLTMKYGSITLDTTYVRTAGWGNGLVGTKFCTILELAVYAQKEIPNGTFIATLPYNFATHVISSSNDFNIKIVVVDNRIRVDGIIPTGTLIAGFMSIIRL